MKTTKTLIPVTKKKKKKKVKDYGIEMETNYKFYKIK